MNRRGFVLSAAAVSLQAQPEREIRTAFIGVGVRGKGLLRSALEKQSLRIRAICDTDAQARDAGLSMASGEQPRSYSDYRQVLELDDVDAVFIATPCDLHAPMAAACLAAGKHVYCEKPCGITPEQVQLVLDATRRSRAVYQIGQQLRYVPALREVIRLIHEERIIGQSFVIKAQRHSTPISEAARLARPAWYKDVKRSGDLIVENAVHNIDVCNWAAGSRPVSAYGHGKRYFPTPIPAGTEMMDGFSVEYIYENDMHLDYSQLYLHPRALKDLANNQWYMIFGEKGTLDLTKGKLYEFSSEQPRDLLSPETLAAREDAMGDFLKCIRENRKPYAGIEVAATAALTCIMGREAIYRRRMVTWQELGIKLG